MNDEIIKLLSVRRLPGRLNSEQAAPLLGFMQHDLPVLVRAGLLRPLANPAPNSVKYYASRAIEQNAKDEGWLNRATKAVYAYWAAANRKRSSKRRQAEPILKAA